MVLLRYAAATAAGMAGAVMLFWLMQRLIVPDERVLDKGRDHRLVEFVRLKHEPTPPERTQRRPKEPEPEPMPDMRLPAPAAQAPKPTMELNARMPAPARRFGGGAKLSLEAFRGDSELMPLVRLAPQYPQRASNMGIEGHVRARLDVDERGEVSHVEIIESVPEGEFDRNARRALKRWKFKPKIVDGNAVAYQGTVTLEFKLKKQTP